MASGGQSFANNINRRPTALEVTQSKKSKSEQIETDIPRPGSESSGEEMNYDVQEYVNKLEEENGDLKEELAKLRRLTSISLPGSLLTVIFPNTSNSSSFRDKLSAFIQDFCKEDDLPQNDSTQDKDTKLVSVEFNATFSLERTSNIPLKNATTLTHATLIQQPTNAPKYSQIYNRIIQPKNTKQVSSETGELLVKPLIRLDSSQPNRPVLKCFNCEGKHHLRDCKEIRDFSKIQANKQEYLNAQGGEQQHNRVSIIDHDNTPNPESSMGRREEFRHPQSHNSRDNYRREPYRREMIEMRSDEPHSYHNNQHSRGRSRGRDERIYHGSRHNHHHFYSEDRNYSHHGHSYNSNDRDIHRRITSTPTKGSDRDVRKVDIRDKLDSGEYSNTYADMDLSDQDAELEEGEISNRSPGHSHRSPPPLPAFNPYISPPPPPPMHHFPPHYYNHPRNHHTFTEMRREPPSRKLKYQHSHSMPDIGSKRKLSRRSPVGMHSEDSNQDSSDASNTFKTNEHNFSLDFPPGIVTPDSMRAPERFNSIRRIIDRRK